MMKNLMLTTATVLALMSGAAFATSPDNCTRIGNSNNFRCNVGGDSYNVNGAESAASAAAAAAAYAAQKQSQNQGQVQGQSQNSSNSNDNSNRVNNEIDNKNTNTNVNGNSNENKNTNANVNGNSNSNSASNSSSNVNGGNSVNIEGDPEHTTSFNVGVGIGITARLGEGVRARSVTEAADWLAKNGQDCLALKAMLEVHPDLKKLKKEVNCK